MHALEPRPSRSPWPTVAPFPQVGLMDWRREGVERALLHLGKILDPHPGALLQNHPTLDNNTHVRRDGTGAVKAAGSARQVVGAGSASVGGVRSLTTLAPSRRSTPVGAPRWDPLQGLTPPHPSFAPHQIGPPLPLHTHPHPCSLTRDQ